jgi:hypothetical protein
VLLAVEETGVPGENLQPASNHWQTLSHNLVSSTPRQERNSNIVESGIKHHTLSPSSCYVPLYCRLLQLNVLHDQSSANKNIFIGWLVGWFMVFNATFNNISVISWQSVLLVEETRVPGENHRPVANH